ncbi:hypothetical protein ACFQ2M_32580 [Kitasatospora saccharophila]|uniref:hypothetical protein n=1 Tax=Kitasatospora saccharophila TaxID=407973 RepID=UPI003628498F
MGYQTVFTGRIAVEPPLNPQEVAYLRKFAGTRRMDRDRGPYFVDGTGFMGQGHDPDVRDHNEPPAGQPGLWCKWEPTADGAAIAWNRNEKFYRATEWMAYLVEHFLRPGARAAGEPGFEGFTFDHVLDGVVDARGEESYDELAVDRARQRGVRDRAGGAPDGVDLRGLPRPGRRRGRGLLPRRGAHPVPPRIGPPAAGPRPGGFTRRRGRAGRGGRAAGCGW